MAKRILAQLCAQCDYLSCFLAGRSLKGHHHRSLSLTHTLDFAI